MRLNTFGALLGSLALCAQLPAETMFVVLGADSSGDATAVRLKSLGASDIQDYRALHLLRASIPQSTLRQLKNEPGVVDVVGAGVVEAGENAGLIDRIEQCLTASGCSGTEISEAVQHGTAAFARLVDRIAAEHDFSIFTSGSFSSTNTIRATNQVPDLQTLVGGTTAHRHLVLRAMAEHGAAQSFRVDSVTTKAGHDFQFYRVAKGSVLHATIAWDRHFDAGSAPYRRQLNMFLYNADGSQAAASSDAGISSDGTSDRVLKVKLLNGTSSPAGEEPFALATSGQDLQPIKTPTLDVNCSRGESVLNCTVTNTGELSVSGVTAHLHGVAQTLGTIDPAATRAFTVQTGGDDAGDPHLTVRGEVFSEMIHSVAISASATTPDPPQLSLSCAYTTQTMAATVITCTDSASGSFPINGVTVTAGQQKVTLGTLNGGDSQQAVFNFPGTGFTGTIVSQGTADQPVLSNALNYTVANQPPQPGNPPECTDEGSIQDAQPYPAVGGSGSVMIKSQATCRTFLGVAPNSLTGLTVLDYGGGLGNRTVALSVAANILPDQSTNSITWNLLLNDGVALVPVNMPATQAGLTCTFQPSASLLTVPMSGGSGTVTMNVQPNCQWSSMTDSSGFIQFMQPGSMTQVPSCCTTGPGTVPYVVDANNSAVSRPFTLIIGGVHLSGTQLGTASTPCTFSATASGLSNAYSGGSGGITVTANQSTCSSIISSDSPSWLTLSGASGTGTRTATFSAAPNTQVNGSTSARTAMLTVQGSDSGKVVFTQTFSVSETGLSCSYTPNPSTVTLPATGVPQATPTSISVTVPTPACQWTASTTSSFLHLVSGATGTNTGNGTVSFWADANSSTSSNSGFIEIGNVSADVVETGKSSTFDIGGTLIIPPTVVVDLSKITISVYDKTTNAKAIVATIDKTSKTWSASGLKTGDSFEVVIVGVPNFVAGVVNYSWDPVSYENITNATPHLHALNFTLIAQRFFIITVVDAHGVPIPTASVTFNPVRENSPQPEGTDKDGQATGYVREDVTYTVTVTAPGNSSFTPAQGTLSKNGNYRLTFKSSDYAVAIKMTLTNAAAGPANVTEVEAATIQKSVTFTFTGAPAVNPLPAAAGLTANAPEKNGNNWVLSWRQDGFVDTTPGGQKVTYTAKAAITVPPQLGLDVALTSASSIHVTNAQVNFTAKVTP